MRCKDLTFYFSKHSKFLKSTYGWLSNLDLKFSKLKCFGNFLQVTLYNIDYTIPYSKCTQIHYNAWNIITFRWIFSNLTSDFQLWKFQVKISQPSISRFQKFWMFCKVDGLNFPTELESLQSAFKKVHIMCRFCIFSYKCQISPSKTMKSWCRWSDSAL